MSDDPLAQKLDVILRERGYRNRDSKEAAFFLDLIEKQFEVHRHRQALLLARMELDRAQQAIDAPTGVYPPWIKPVPTIAEVEAKKDAERAEFDLLLGLVAEWTCQVLHPGPFRSPAYNDAVKELGVLLAGKAAVLGLSQEESPLVWADWEVVAETAIVYLSALKEKD